MFSTTNSKNHSGNTIPFPLHRKPPSSRQFGRSTLRRRRPSRKKSLLSLILIIVLGAIFDNSVLAGTIPGWVDQTPLTSPNQCYTRSNYVYIDSNVLVAESPSVPTIFSDKYNSANYPSEYNSYGQGYSTSNNIAVPAHYYLDKIRLCSMAFLDEKPEQVINPSGILMIWKSSYDNASQIIVKLRENSGWSSYYFQKQCTDYDMYTHSAYVKTVQVIFRKYDKKTQYAYNWDSSDYCYQNTDEEYKPPSLFKVVIITYNDNGADSVISVGLNNDTEDFLWDLFNPAYFGKNQRFLGLFGKITLFPNSNVCGQSYTSTHPMGAWGAYIRTAGVYGYDLDNSACDCTSITLTYAAQPITHTITYSGPITWDSLEIPQTMTNDVFADMYHCGTYEYTIQTGDTTKFSISTDSSIASPPTVSADTYQTQIYLAIQNLDCSDIGMHSIVIRSCLYIYPDRCVDIAVNIDVVIDPSLIDQNGFTDTSTTDSSPLQFDLTSPINPFATFVKSSNNSPCVSTYSRVTTFVDIVGTSATVSEAGTNASRTFSLTSLTNANEGWKCKIVYQEIITLSLSSEVILDLTHEFYFEVYSSCSGIAIVETGGPLQNLNIVAGGAAAAATQETNYDLQKDGGVSLGTNYACGVLVETITFSPIDYAAESNFANIATTAHTFTSFYYQFRAHTYASEASGWSMPMTVTVTLTITNVLYPAVQSVKTFDIIISPCVVSTLTGTNSISGSTSAQVWDPAHFVTPDYYDTWDITATYTQSLDCSYALQVSYSIDDVTDPSNPVDVTTIPDKAGLFSYDSSTKIFRFNLDNLLYVGDYQITAEYYVENADGSQIFSGEQLTYDISITNPCLIVTQVGFTDTTTTVDSPFQYDLVSPTNPFATFNKSHQSTCNEDYSQVVTYVVDLAGTPATVTASGSDGDASRTFSLSGVDWVNEGWKGKIIVQEISKETHTGNLGVLFDYTHEFYFEVTNSCSGLDIAQLGSAFNDLTIVVGGPEVIAASVTNIDLQRNGVSQGTDETCGVLIETISFSPIPYDTDSTLNNNANNVHTSTSRFYKYGAQTLVSEASGWSLPLEVTVTLTVSNDLYSQFTLTNTFKIIIEPCFVTTLTGTNTISGSTSAYIWDNLYFVSPDYYDTWDATATYTQDYNCLYDLQVTYDIKDITDSDPSNHVDVTTVAGKTDLFTYDSVTKTFKFKLDDLLYVGIYRITVEYFVANTYYSTQVSSGEVLTYEITIINPCLSATITPPGTLDLTHILRTPQSTEYSYSNPTYACTPASNCQCGEIRCDVGAYGGGIDPDTMQYNRETELSDTSIITQDDLSDPRTIQVYAYDDAYLTPSPTTLPHNFQFECSFADYSTVQMDQVFTVEFQNCVTGITAYPMYTDPVDRIEMAAGKTITHQINVVQEPVANDCGYDLLPTSPLTYSSDGIDQFGNPRAFTTVSISDDFEITFESITQDDIGIYDIVITFELQSTQTPNQFPNAINTITLEVVSPCLYTEFYSRQLPEFIVFNIQTDPINFYIYPFDDVESALLDPSLPHFLCDPLASKSPEPTANEYVPNSAGYLYHVQVMSIVSSGERVMETEAQIQTFLDSQISATAYTDQDLFDFQFNQDQEQLQQLTGVFLKSPHASRDYVNINQKGFILIDHQLEELYLGTHYYGLKVLLRDHADIDILNNQLWVPFKVSSYQVLPNSNVYTQEYTHTISDNQISITFPGFQIEPEPVQFEDVFADLGITRSLLIDGNDVSSMPGFTWDEDTLTLSVLLKSNSYAKDYSISYVWEIPQMHDDEFYYYNTAQIQQDITLKVNKFVEPIVTNNPPYFENPELKNVQLECGESLKYQLEKPIDPEDDDVEMTVDLRSTSWFAEFDEFKRQIIVEADVINPSMKGVHNIKVNLVDTFNNEVTYMFDMVIICEEKQNITWVPELPEVPKVIQLDIGYTVPSITKVNRMGQVFVQFNNTMLPHENSTQYIETGTCFVMIEDEVIVEKPVLEVKLIRGDPPEFQDDQQEDLYNFTWSVADYDRNYLNLDLIFAHPLYISSTDIRDSIELTFWGIGNFTDADLLPLAEKQVCTALLPGQVDQSTGQAIESLATSVESGSTSAVVINVVLNMLMQGSLQLILNAIKSLQIIVHMHMINVTSPANASAFNAALSTIVQFDMINTDPLYGAVFDLNPEKEEDPNFLDLGYETEFFISNLGSLFLFMVSLPLLLVMCKVISSKCTKKRCKDWADNQLKSFFWNGVITFFNESYLLLAICIFINMEFIKWQTGGEQFNSLFTISFMIIIIVFPFFIAIFYGWYCYLFNEKDFKAMYGAIIEEMNARRLGGIIIIYVVGSLLRRLLLAVILVYLTWHSTFQIQLFNYLILAMVIMTGHVNPFKQQFMNKLEIFNEASFLVVNYHLMCFTSFVPDPQPRFLVGYSQMIIISLNMAINIGIAVGISLMNCIRRQRLKRILKNKIKEQQRKKLAFEQRQKQLQEFRKREEEERKRQEQIDLTNQFTESLKNQGSSLVEHNNSLQSKPSKNLPKKSTTQKPMKAPRSNKKSTTNADEFQNSPMKVNQNKQPVKKPSLKQKSKTSTSAPKNKPPVKNAKTQPKKSFFSLKNIFKKKKPKTNKKYAPVTDQSKTNIDISKNVPDIKIEDYDDDFDPVNAYGQFYLNADFVQNRPKVFVTPPPKPAVVENKKTIKLKAAKKQKSQKINKSKTVGKQQKPPKKQAEKNQNQQEPYNEYVDYYINAIDLCDKGDFDLI